MRQLTALMLHRHVGRVATPSTENLFHFRIESPVDPWLWSGWTRGVITGETYWELSAGGKGPRRDARRVLVPLTAGDDFDRMQWRRCEVLLPAPGLFCLWSHGDGTGPAGKVPLRVQWFALERQAEKRGGAGHVIPPPVGVFARSTAQTLAQIR
jgi:hypothetical protein